MARSPRSLRQAAVATAVTAGILLGAAAVPLGTVAPASAASTPMAASEIVSRAVDQAKRQGAARDYTAPLSKPTWKFLFVGVSDVTFPGDPARHIVTADEKKYTQYVVDQFVYLLTSRAGVRATATVKWIDEPHTATETDRRLHEWEFADRFAEWSAPAEYDSIMLMSKGGNGGVTMPAYYNDTATRGAGFEYFTIRPRTGAPTDVAPTNDIELSTNYALHELGHQMSYSRKGFPYPDLHNASAYGYTVDPRNEWAAFYLDYLSGNVNADGIPMGAFPKMWSVSPRFLHRPAMATVHFQDEGGRPIAPDVDTFGAGGDPLTVTAPVIDGYRSVAPKATKAAPEATFSTGTTTDITLVYSPGPTKVAFVGGETFDLTQSRTLNPGTTIWSPFTYRAATPVTGFTYTDQIVGIDGARRVDSLPGAPLRWDTSGTAVVTDGGNTYTATKKSSTLVEVAVQLGTPSTTFVVRNLGYASSASAGRVHQRFDLLDITPQLTGVKEEVTTEPHGHVQLTWGDYTLAATFSGGETTDINRVDRRAPGEQFFARYGYRTAFPVTAFTYLDRLAEVDGVRRVDLFDGQPVTWTASGTATVNWLGNAVTLTRKSDTLVEVRMTLKAPSTTLVVPGMGYTNSAATGRAKRSVEFVDVTSELTGRKDAQPRAPKGNNTVTWGDHRTTVAFSGGQTVDLFQNTTVAPGKIYWNGYTYRAAVPVIAFTYTDRIVSISGARRCDSLRGVALNWDAAGIATVTKDGNTYTAVRKSDTLVEISVRLGTPSTTFTLQDVGYGNVAPVGHVEQTYDLLDVTPELTGVKEAMTSEPHGHVTLTWTG
ncbi:MULTISPECIES: MucBP domain-containing protein [unclassified Leifsonia]|uniref:MucBP domain-containing protein n=1 Tax=unclassified Leifsonia TaxID=2663824 RepID=UPI0003735DBD|nr:MULTISPECIES: MucBP domain-containing protein [unclassified Leifsonia]TDQ03233.1 hypothetical protein AXZ95_1515 [Leifsonia sp. 115AMFTsu3.1]